MVGSFRLELLAEGRWFPAWELASRQRPVGVLLRIKVFHEFIQKAMTPLASEHAVGATTLHNGSVTEQHTSEFSQQGHNPIQRPGR